MTAAMRLLVALLLTLSVGPGVYTVDRGNFKTCSQSSFCRRQRATSSGDFSYDIVKDSVKPGSAAVNFQIVNIKNNIPLNVDVFCLSGNSVRLKINEINPLRHRYQVEHSLAGEPQLQNCELEQNDESIVMKLRGKDNLAVIYRKPFRLDLYSEGELVVSANQRQLLHFEHYRQKSAEKVETEKVEENEAPEQQHQQDGEEEVEEKVKEEDVNEDGDIWEETYKSHHDSKPFGPSSIGMDFAFPGFQHVYGIPEHADSMALRTTASTDPYRLYNLDVFEYELNNPMALYGSIPYMLAHNERKTVGIFWHNAAETWVDIANNKADVGAMRRILTLLASRDEEVPQVDTHWMSESGLIDVFFMLGPRPTDVFRQYATLTGFPALPPLFAIAYHQCRWNYNDERDVKQVNVGFETHNIPYDVIWLDIEHTNGKRYFTWDANKFPSSKNMIDNIASFGRKMVTIVDPHLKAENSYKHYKEAKERGFLVKNKNGEDFEGWCWPGTSAWADFLDPAVRQWWAGKFSLAEYEGSTEHLYIWNDMNEPSVFNGPEVTMHKDLKHFGDWEHRDVHNVYGMFVHNATVQGLLERSGGQLRPFVLSRAFFAGTQRLSAVWTGDNMGEWSHLEMSMPMLLSLSLAGLPFVGADVGGFFKNPDPELLIRWYQAGAYQPFFRAHAHLDTKRREPWLFAQNEMLLIRDAIIQRYNFLPYWYTLYYEAERTGEPMMRAMWVEFPADPATFAMDDQYMVGAGMLVKPVTSAGQQQTRIYLPASKPSEIWYDKDSFEVVTKSGENHVVNTPINKIPVFYRGGSIIPRKERLRRSSGLAQNDPYTLFVALNSKGEADGTLFIDDGASYKYKDGAYIYRKFTFDGSTLKSRSIDKESSFQTKSWLERVIVLGLTRSPKNVEITTHEGTMRLLHFNSQGKPEILIIRKPTANMGRDWTMTFTF